MYTKNMFKKIRSIIPETIASSDSTSVNRALLNTTSLCGITGSTTKTLGQNFNVTIVATTGAIYVCPEMPSGTVPTSATAFKIPEGGVLDVKIENFLAVRGDSTTAAFEAIVWGE